MPKVLELILFCPHLYPNIGSQDSSVRAVARLRSRQSGFDSRQGQVILSLVTAFTPLWGPPVDTGDFSSRIKRTGRAADQSRPSMAEVKNDCN
jgi:hypothetical protein